MSMKLVPDNQINRELSISLLGVNWYKYLFILYIFYEKLPTQGEG